MKGVVVGCGYFAGIHLDGWVRLNDLCSIAAVCDIDRKAAERRAGEYGVERTYTDYVEMFETERPNFVDVVTRPDLHLEVVRAAAERGITVLCQKPLAPDYAGAEAIVACCEQYNVRLMANENWRWQAWYRELKRLLDEGAIGKPFYFTLRHRIADGVGPMPYPRQPYFSTMDKLLLIETMIHFIDTARFLMGDLRVRACEMRRVNPAVQAEDVVLMVMEGADGLLGTIDGNRLSHAEQDGEVMGDARIEGERGALSLRGDGRIFARPVTGEGREHFYSIPTIGYRGDSVYHTLRHFLTCLRDGSEFESHGRDYLKTTQLVFDGYRMAGRV